MKTAVLAGTGAMGRALYRLMAAAVAFTMALRWAGRSCRF